jgi:hypothetical protein
VSSDDLDQLIDALGRWVPALLDEPERAAAIVTACRQAARTIPSGEPIADAVARIEAAAHPFSRHLLLFVDPDGTRVPDDADRGWPAPDPRQVRRRGGGVGGVHRDADGVVTIELDSLEPIDLAEPQIDAAIALAQGATGVIIDLRRNGGGDPGTVARVAGFVLGHPPTRLATVHARHGAETVWDSDPPPASSCVPADVPVAVLTSGATFSSAEALAYHLRVRERITIVGEQTPGAADHVSPFVLTRFVHAQLPVARVVDAVTERNWEGTGVRPDIACDADVAHQRALEWLAARPRF